MQRAAMDRTGLGGGNGERSMVRILIADDHEVIRRGLRQMIERHPDWEVCGEAATGADGLRHSQQTV